MTQVELGLQDCAREQTGKRHIITSPGLIGSSNPYEKPSPELGLPLTRTTYAFTPVPGTWMLNPLMISCHSPPLLPVSTR